MITRSFINKSNTIVKNLKLNFGLNPISMLTYGKETSRFLLSFDISKLRQLKADKVINDEVKCRHYLKMVNCASLNNTPFKDSHRATSFTIVAFKIPNQWHAGVGFDDSADFWLTGEKAISRDGSTWYNSASEVAWETNGIYTISQMSEELEKFNAGEESIIVGIQDFDYGNEDLNMDITDFVNSLINNEEEFFGIGISFVPNLESIDNNIVNYVGFFNNNTNTHFKPYVETYIDTDYFDNRFSFYLNKINKLYLLANIDGSLDNLDELPTCQVNGKNYEVVQEGKGIYSISLILTSSEYKHDMILFDTWSNIKYKGVELDDIEQEFVTKRSDEYYRIGELTDIEKELYPVIDGINDGQELNRTDKHRVNVSFKLPYTRGQYQLVNNAYYRIYVKDGKNDLITTDWEKISCLGYHNLFYIDGSDYQPNTYYVDVQLRNHNQIRTHKECLKFVIK